jgi:hypothetical protein
MGAGHQHWCRDCFRDYFAHRGDVHRRQTADAKRIRVEAARALALAHLVAHPCLDCGDSDPVVLEFDHVDAKRADISNLVAHGSALGNLEREIAACEVVCANCHRRRTARRANWIRADVDWRLAVEQRAPRGRRTNLLIAYGVLERSGCRDCGTRDLRVLEFDHLGGKVAPVSRLVFDGADVDRVRKEIAECVVRCANCHRKKTAHESGHYRALPSDP